MRSTGSRLVHIDREPIPQFSRKHFIRGPDDRVCDRWPEQTEILVDHCCGSFDVHRRVDIPRHWPDPADRKILQSPMRLNAIVRVCRDLLLSEGIFLHSRFHSRLLFDRSCTKYKAPGKPARCSSIMNPGCVMIAMALQILRVPGQMPCPLQHGGCFREHPSSLWQRSLLPEDATLLQGFQIPGNRLLLPS